MISPPTRPSSSPLSSFADCKPPLASKHVDVAPAPWCAPQVRSTIAPVSRVSCTSCSTPRSSSLARGHSFPWTFSYLWTYSLPIRMFPFSFFILDSSLSLLASLSPPLPSDFDYRRSFRPRAFTLNTGSPFAYDAARSVAGRTTLFGLRLYFSPPSLCSVHCIAADSDRINTPRWPRRKEGKSAHIPPSFVCVSGQPRPLLSCFRLCSRFLVTRPTRSRLSPPATAVREPVRSAHSISAHPRD